MELSGNAIGFLSQIGMRYRLYFIEAGYRWLKFTDVWQEPKGGFTVQPGNLPESLDYSGFVIKMGVGMEFYS